MNFKLLFLLLLLLPIVYGVTPGDDYTLTNFSRCYGDIEVKLRGVKQIEVGDYSFKDCNIKQGNLWSCPCAQDKNNVILQTKNTIENVYDIVVQYYIKPYINNPENDLSIENLNHNNRRVLNFNNINVAFPIIEERHKFSFVDIDISVSNTFIFIGVLLLLMVGVIYGIYYFVMYFLMHDDNIIDGENLIGDTYDEKGRKSKQALKLSEDIGKHKVITDEDVDDFIRNI